MNEKAGIKKDVSIGNGEISEGLQELFSKIKDVNQSVDELRRRIDPIILQESKIKEELVPTIPQNSSPMGTYINDINFELVEVYKKVIYILQHLGI